MEILLAILILCVVILAINLDARLNNLQDQLCRTENKLALIEALLED